MELFTDIALRVVAVFYAFVQLAGIRRLAMDRLLDNAIAAISGKKDDSSEGRADRLRWQTLLLLLLIGGPASILAAAMMSAAIPLLALTAVLSLANVAYVLPRYVDPFEPPDPAARRNSWLATLCYLLFTLWAMLHWRNGGMTAIAQTKPVVAGIALAFILLFAVHVFFTLRKASLGKPAAFGSVASDNEAFSEEFLAAEQAEKEFYRGVKFVLRPALGESALFRADTGAVVPYDLPVEEIDYATKEDLRRWQTSLRDALDKSDPRRVRFASDTLRKAIEAEGQRLFDRLQELVGKDRIAFQPEPTPEAAACSPDRLIMRARLREWPTADAATPEDGIFPGNLGISMQLEDDLLDWSSEYDEARLAAAIDEYLSGKPDWSRERWADFEARGRALAQRIEQELAATGRANVRVDYHEPEIWPDAPR